MIVHSLRLKNVRCFGDTGDLLFSPRFNILVGQNNSGKSTLLKAIFGLQLNPFDQHDIRTNRNNENSFRTIVLANIRPDDEMLVGRDLSIQTLRLIFTYQNPPEAYTDYHALNVPQYNTIFHSQRPLHRIVPFLAARKAQGFNHDISSNAQNEISGTLKTVYSRIDLLVTRGHPKHEMFCSAVEQIVGLQITTRASPSGKEAGFYFDEHKFVTLDRMGDGVSEMLALIVELCTEQHKIFVLEEPETNLHPSGLKALLDLVRGAAEKNQFFISTHSNIVLRELGEALETKIFQVSRVSTGGDSPSSVTEVEKTTEAHLRILRDLGYEFLDYNLYEGWLFLEESSAESIISEILIPSFVPELRGLIRTFSAAGITKLPSSIDQFQRLIVFIHLQPVYKNRLWARVDGDDVGIKTVARLRSMFPDYSDDAFDTFKEKQFEHYYPKQFQTDVAQTLAIQDPQTKRQRKSDLLKTVLEWTGANSTLAIAQWKESASEPIEFLRQLQGKLATV